MQLSVCVVQSTPSFEAIEQFVQDCAAVQQNLL